MKIARCEKDGKVFFASLEGAYARPLKNEPYVGLALADGPAAPLKAVRLLTPVTPTKILAVGFNYRDHAEEFHKPIPKTPNIFMKPLSCLNGPDGAVELPGRCAGQA